jgi:hypothetical protein
MNQQPVNTLENRPWLFAPTKGRASIVTARIPSALEQELELERQRRGVNRSDLVVAALEAFLLGKAS